MKQNMYISAPVYIDKNDYNILLNSLQSFYNVNIKHTGLMVYNFLKELLLEEKINIKNKNILDVGCNIGTFSFLLEEFKAKFVTGIDIQDFFINTCIMTRQKLMKSNMLFYQQDFFNPAMCFKKFDMIFIIYSFLYLLEPGMDMYNKIEAFKRYIYSKPSPYIIFAYWMGGKNNYKFDTAKQIIECVYQPKYIFNKEECVFIVYKKNK